MPLARIEIEQLSHDRWHVEFEGAGISADRKVHNASSFEDVIDWLIEEHERRGRTVAIPKVPDQPITGEPWKAPAPIGRRAAGKMRKDADEAADAGDVEKVSRRAEIAARDLRRS